MHNEPIHIVPFEPSHESAIMQIEKASGQGRWVTVEMLRSHYRSRGEMFNAHHALVALTDDLHVAGAVIGAQTPIRINGEQTDVGIGLDLRVDPAFRGRGIGTALCMEITQDYFAGRGLKKFFILAKSANPSLHHMLRRSGQNAYYHPCHYLTIPTRTRLSVPQHILPPPRFSVSLLEKKDAHAPYTIRCGNGICAWNTSLMYMLRISRVHPVLALAARMMLRFRNMDFPPIGTPLRIATLYNLDGQNFRHLPEALQILHRQGFTYANIVCAKNDTWFPLLKKHALFAYAHQLITNFPTAPTDRITLDVRGL